MRPNEAEILAPVAKKLIELEFATSLSANMKANHPMT